MLTQADRETIANIIAAALESLPERLREIVREELAKLPPRVMVDLARDKQNLIGSDWRVLAPPVMPDNKVARVSPVDPQT